MADEGVQSAFARYSIGGKKMCFERIKSNDRALIIDHSARLNCGTRSHSAADQSPGPMFLGYTVFLEPTPEEWVEILPKLGLTLATGTWTFSGETLPTFTSQIDRVESVRTYSTCKVNRAQIYSATGQPLICALEVVAMSYSDGNQGTFSGDAVSSSSTPYVHNQGVFTSGGSTVRKYSSFMYALNNRVVTEHNNSVLPTNQDEGDRVEQVHLNFPANTEHEDLIALDWGASRVAGFAAFATFTRGGKSLRFDWESLKANGAQPEIPMRGKELRYQQVWNAYKATTSSTIVTSDITA